MAATTSQAGGGTQTPTIGRPEQGSSMPRPSANYLGARGSLQYPAPAPGSYYECGEFSHMRRECPRIVGGPAPQRIQSMSSAPAPPPSAQPARGGAHSAKAEATVTGVPAPAEWEPQVRARISEGGAAYAAKEDLGRGRKCNGIPAPAMVAKEYLGAHALAFAKPCEPRPTCSRSPSRVRVGKYGRGGPVHFALRVHTPTAQAPRHATVVYHTPGPQPVGEAHPVAAVVPEPRPAAADAPLKLLDRWTRIYPHVYGGYPGLH
uniref:Skin secretory protein xP2-like n=1 Tax=Nicotiana tabacum TaxID=4097 RepID=A0A1S3YS90_TOBAC|nr:PREDICTED: skin secretory protein xP2-like [Nicotiana tabacum]